ncbi:uncharacterized protein LOC124945870 [Impatiens glandulifera]|uniref:uncharacterized protein LOC124945870 n=1 Tax=Impatiens glandulifera TaxID=253017 RepID=UPI001FB06B1B|nr:uncharacterized protein LOC124945870 [Impatiens glandulifera]
MEEPSHNKRVRDEDSDELYLNSPEVKRLREDLLDDSDPSFTTPEDLDSFMKSFQEEISAFPPSPASSPAPNQFVESGDSMPDLGYLLEASDDELGLPPSTTPVSEVASNEEIDRTEFGELWRFDDQIPSYDSFEFGIYGCQDNNFNDGEFVALDGLFDYSDFGAGTLPAQ